MHRRERSQVLQTYASQQTEQKGNKEKDTAKKRKEINEKIGKETWLIGCDESGGSSVTLPIINDIQSVIPALPHHITQLDARHFR